MDYDKYFKIDKTDAVIFIGNKLEIHIPKRYENHGCVEIGEEVKTLAIFDMIINDSVDTGYFLPAHICIIPTNIETVNINNKTYFKLTLYKGDVFIKNINVVKNPQLAFVMFYEFIFLGNMPKFIDYNKSAFIFDKVKDICGINFRSNKVVFEIMSAHLYRTENDLTQPYRLTDMKNEPVNIPLRAVTHAATSTSSKLIGSYYSSAINSALVNQANESSQVEDLLRL